MFGFCFVLALCSVWNVSGLFSLLFFANLKLGLAHWRIKEMLIICWFDFFLRCCCFCSLAAVCFFMQLIRCWMTYVISVVAYNFHVFNRTCDYFFLNFSLLMMKWIHCRKKIKLQHLCINLFHKQTQRLMSYSCATFCFLHKMQIIFLMGQWHSHIWEFSIVVFDGFILQSRPTGRQINGHTIRLWCK